MGGQITKFRDLPEKVKTRTIAMVLGITEKETKQGKAYLEVSLSDWRGEDGSGSDKIIAKLWNTSAAQFEPQPGDIIGAELYPKPYNGELGYELFSYETNPGYFNPEEFLVSAPFSGETCFDNILRIIANHVPEGDLTRLVTAIYHKNREKLLVHGAAKAIHHNYVTGLLYHTLRMVALAARVPEVYRSLDAELLICGAALHDIGKLVELETNPLGESDYTPDGILFGHLLLGDEIIRDASKELGIDGKEKVKLLRHLIASHHGKQEWGAISVPAIPEATVLHELDMIDSRVEVFEQELKNLEPGTAGPRINALGQSVYRAAEEPAEEEPEAE